MGEGLQLFAAATSFNWIINRLVHALYFLILLIEIGDITEAVSFLFKLLTKYGKLIKTMNAKEFF